MPSMTLVSAGAVLLRSLAIVVMTASTPSFADPTPEPALATDLANLDPAWQLRVVDSVGTFTRADQTVTVELISGCEAYRDTLQLRGLEIFRHNTGQADLCLPLRRHGLLVRGGLPLYDREALVLAIGDRLRPAVEIPALGLRLRPSVFVEPTADGFLAFGKSTSRFVVSSRRGTCGMTELEADSFIPLGPPDLAMPRLIGTATRLELCRERDNDALVISISDPTYEILPSSPSRPMVERELALLIRALDSALSRTSRPRIFNGDVLALPKAGFDLKGSHAMGRGWVTVDRFHAFKLVDGSAWNEPDADVLLPIEPYAYAVVVRREPCTGQSGSSPFVPREVALSDHLATSYQARACIQGAITASVLQVGASGTPNNPSRARVVIAALARSRGMRIEGGQGHLDYHGVLSVPIYRASSGGSRVGLALRGGGSWLVGRPVGFVLLGGIALGIANDNYHPETEERSASAENDVHADGVFEIYGGGGGALTLGRLTAGVAITVHGDVFWPGTRDVFRGVGLAALQLGEDSRIEVRSSVGLEHRSTTHEVIVRFGPFMAMARTTDLLDAPGPRGFELGFGLDRPRR